MKKTIIHARVDEVEKKKIEHLASSQGCTVSEYIRDTALHSLHQSSQQKLIPKVYVRLCELTDLIEQIDDPSLQTKFKDWRHGTWQVLK